MPNASRTVLNEIDQTFSPADTPLGVSGISGVFKRGPVNDLRILTSSWAQFSKLYGGLVANDENTIAIKRAFERGASIRVNGLRHYTDPANKASLTATKAVAATGKFVTLNGPLITANTLAIIINGNSISQIFTTNSDNTFNLWVAKALQTLPGGVISKIAYLGSNKIIITPATGITLTVTGSVTGGTTQATVTISDSAAAKNSGGTTLFTLVPKYPGQDYNNLQVDILAASNGDANSFDIAIEHLLEPQLNEIFRNLKIIGNPTAPASSYLQAVVNGSQLVDVTYADISGTSGQQRPLNTYLKYDTGTDGGAIVDADMVGDSGAKTGHFAFDGYDDMLQIGTISSAIAVHQAGAQYAQNRKDLVYFAHLDNTYVTESQLVVAKDAMLIDSTYVGWFAGGLIVTDPFTSLPRNITELGDILGAAAYSQAKFGPWLSFGGKKRGLIYNALGVVNNFGLDSNYAGRNLLANHQINLVINKKGRIQISGNFTGQLENSTLSYLNVRFMLIYLKKILGPILDNYIEEPNDIPTWKLIYQEVRPVLKKLKDGRAIYDFDWQGDQFAPSIDKVVINNAADLGNGKYHVKLYIKPIVSLQEITVDITLTPSDVSFEDNLSQIVNS